MNSPKDIAFDLQRFGKASHSLYKKLLDLIHIGILVTDKNGIIQYLNPAFGKMFEMDVKGAVSKSITDYFPNSHLIPVLKTGETHHTIEFAYKGQEALCNRYPIYDGDEIVGGFIEVYFRDINELKEIMMKMTDLKRKVAYYKRKSQGLPAARYSFDSIVGESRPILALKELGRRFANSAQPILVYGESGTGKELVSHALHAASSRCNEAFISVNCAAIPKDLMESELFGFEEGTFTGAKAGGKIGKFELADKGTIFLDEIGELPFEMQAKLLRVIENKEIQKIGNANSVYSDFRLIAATNRDLRKLVADGVFRADLYHRLNILAITVPPLRERPGDILELAYHLLSKNEDRALGAQLKFSDEAATLLYNYSWPGNIRELKNVISFSVLSLDDGQTEIHARNLPPYLLEKSGGRSIPNLYSLSKAREKTDKETLRLALERTNGNKAQAARMLGISRNELYKKLNKFNII